MSDYNGKNSGFNDECYPPSNKVAPGSLNEVYKSSGIRRNSMTKNGTGTTEERSIAGAKFLDKFKTAMNREKGMYTTKPAPPKNTKVMGNMNKAFGREKNVNNYEKHEELVVGVSDMNDAIKMEEVIVQDEDLIECPEGCGRKFRIDALEKHKNACKKVFQTKRKEFDTKKHRTLTQEQILLEKKQTRKDKINKKANTKGKGKGNSL